MPRSIEVLPLQLILQLAYRLLGLACGLVAQIVDEGDIVAQFFAALHLGEALEVVLKVLGLNAFSDALLLSFDALLGSMRHAGQVGIKTYLRYRSQRAVRPSIRLWRRLLTVLLVLDFDVWQALRVYVLHRTVPFGCLVALVVDVDVVEAEVVEAGRIRSVLVSYRVVEIQLRSLYALLALSLMLQR